MLLRSELCNFNLLLTQGLNICMLAFCNIPGLRNYNCSCTITYIQKNHIDYPKIHCLIDKKSIGD